MNHAAFKKFLASNGLSTRRFADQCGIGKTTVHRLAQPSHGGLTAPYVRRITPVVMDACRRHLESAGIGASSVHRYLTEIFGDDFKPMINHRSILTPEVLAFFGLARDPFAPPRFSSELFTTPAIESVYAQLEQAVRCQGFVCLLAPVGAGKTVLKNRLLSASLFSPKSQVQSPKSEALSSPPYEGGMAEGRGGSPMNAQRSNDLGPWTLDFGPASIVISPKFADMSRVTAAGIVAYVLEELGVKPRRALVLAQKQLEQRLAHLAQNNISVALCFDECHHLNDTLLTALKNFYELGTGGFERYLGLILFGQPQFAARLSEPRFREIAERLACLELPAFSGRDSENYLAHCLTSISDFGLRISDVADATSVKGGQRSKIEDQRSEPGAPATGSSSNPQSEIRNPKSLSSPPYKGGVAAASADGVVLSSNSPNSTNSPNSPNSVNLFAPDAIRLITARASTPLGIANAAAAAMLEAYKKGERCVLARFVGESTGPRAMRVGK